MLLVIAVICVHVQYDGHHLWIYLDLMNLDSILHAVFIFRQLME